MGGIRKAAARLAVIAVTLSAVVVIPSLTGSAAANAAVPTAPAVQQRTSNMVSSDELPTVQIDSGVVWTQVISGNTVYAGGSFSNTRPAGAAAGTNLTPRSNLLSYDITTGNLLPFAPTLNGQVKSLALSPDGSTLYVGGSFTQVNGTTHYNLAAFSTATGALLTAFKAQLGGSYVNAIAVTSTAVYVGGLISTANGTARKNLAALDPTSGATLAWAPTTDLQVDAMTLTPAKDKLIVGGRFGLVNGVSQRGMAALDLNSGAMLEWDVASTVVNGGGPSGSSSYGKAGIYSLTTDAYSVYGTGWVYSNLTVGNLEGSFSANPATGAINWIEDCHGDTYSSYSDGTDVYVVNHAHDCSGVGGYPNSNPSTTNLRHMEAFTAATQGVLTRSDIVSSIYQDWEGYPAPAMVNFFPDFVTGSFTGQGQAAWTVTGNGNYLIAGGEFPYVNGQLQQGLARFAVKSISGAHDGPRLSGSRWIPSVYSVLPQTARVTIATNYDRDDLNLNYTIYRQAGTSIYTKTATPVYTTTSSAPFWNQGTITFQDGGLSPGATYTYQVAATDGDGNTSLSSPVTVTVASAALSSYASQVLSDGANMYWRLGGSGAAVGYDWAGGNNGIVGTGVTPASSGAIAGDSNGASTVNGTANGLVSATNAITGPSTYSEEVWFRTTSTTGGEITDFANTATGLSSSHDRMIYLTNSGQLIFGTYNTAVQTVTSPASYNNGQWHHVVATQSSAGMALYVDGKQVAVNQNATTPEALTGYWRLGGDSLSGWTSAPTSQYLAGDIDDFAVYPTALAGAQVAQHYQLAGGSITVPTTPSDVYGAAVYNANPALYWRLNDATGSSTAADSSQNSNAGNVKGGVTFGQSGAIMTGTGAQFNGTSGMVVSSAAVTSPSVYTEQAWFKTSTIFGGKIIGLGNAASGSSSNYDRFVYMQNNGQLVFGTYSGQRNAITTAKSYNDGKWHMVAAKQGPDGMSLYVDGMLVGTNAQTGAQSYTGYWQVGGANTWGSLSGYFSGTIDEAAVYNQELSAATVLSMYQLGTGTAAPTPSFTSQANFLAVNFNSGTSVSNDGNPIASYSWNFGDGVGTSTAANPSYTYAASGTYPVTLTVTNSRGYSSTSTQNVTVVAHAVPVAVISASSTGLTANFSGTGSTASDGATIASYAWNFGDGSTSTVAAPTHVYTAAGTYPVTLTVTDSLGATSTIASQSVTITHAAPVAVISLSNSGLNASFSGSGSTTSDGATIASYAWNFGDGSTSTVSAPTHVYTAAGTYPVTLTVTDSLGAVSQVATANITVTTHAAPIASIKATPTGLTVAFDGTGSTTFDAATIASYAWNFGDGSTGTGAQPTHGYAAAGTYPVTLTVTDSTGASSTVASQPVTVTHAAPVAVIGQSASGLTASLSGTGSTTSDGAAITTYAWNFGDGTTGTGAQPAHTYAAAGFYTVTLTVTDSLGSSATTSSLLSPTSNVIATDTFNRTSSSGWGTSNVGGAWNATPNSSVAAGVGSASVGSGSTVNLYLNSVSAQDVDATIGWALDRLPASGKAYVNLLLRSTSAGDYRAKVYVAPTGVVTLYLARYVGTTETIVATKVLSGLTYVPGTRYDVRFRIVTSGSASTLSAMLWQEGTTIPTTWAVSASDGTAALQVPGRVGLSLYTSSATTNGPVMMTFDNLQAIAP